MANETVEHYEKMADRIEELKATLRKIANHKVGSVSAGMSPWDARATLARIEAEPEIGGE